MLRAYKLWLAADNRHFSFSNTELVRDVLARTVALWEFERGCQVSRDTYKGTGGRAMPES